MATIRGTWRNDNLKGGSSSDTIYGEGGDDTLDGGGGNDTLYGGSGNDAIWGCGGDDIINGGSGDDYIEGGWGRDILTGGTGNDKFGFGIIPDSPAASGWDIITDFTQGADKIDLTYFLNTVDLAWGNTAPIVNGVWYGKAGTSTFVYADVNGDGTADIKIELQNTASLALSANDFLGVAASANSAPVITSPTAFTVNENASSVGTVIATDADGDALTYAIAGGADAKLFTINASTGELAFVNAPDYENPADLGTDNIYDVTVKASDGASSTVQDISITVSNYDGPNIVLTESDDVVNDGSADTEIHGTALTLNHGDSLNGGGGTDTLVLSGEGIYSLDLLSEFNNIEQVRLESESGRIELDLRNGVNLSVTGSSHQDAFILSTGNEKIAARAGDDYFRSGYLGYSNSLTEGDSLDGGEGYDRLEIYDASIDLTKQNLHSIEEVYLLNNSVATINQETASAFTKLNGWGTYQTNEATLDLTNKSVGSSAFFTSANTSGTTFIVDKADTGLQIVGGNGNDTLKASGLVFTAEQRSQIFEAGSIETIIDYSGTYTKPPSGSTINLTLANDVVNDGDANTEIHGIPLTLNPGDRLNGGGGTDTLVLYGSGDYHLDQLSEFSGIEQVRLVNQSIQETGTGIHLRDGVDLSVTGSTHMDHIYLSTGHETIQAGAGRDFFYVGGLYGEQGTLTAGDSLDGGADYDTLQINVTSVDLTASSLHSIEEFYLARGGVATINQAAIADAARLTGSGIFQTGESTLDLSNKSAEYVEITSTNAAGTTFIVNSADTGFAVRGGSSNYDTLQANGFAFTEEQRTHIFTSGSVEVIKDSSGIYGSGANNVIVGDSGPNLISGGGGNDWIKGMEGNDILIGGAGNDQLDGGLGADILTGGEGKDMFALTGSDADSPVASGWDVITDFKQGEDMIDVWNMGGKIDRHWSGTTPAKMGAWYEKAGDSTFLYFDSGYDGVADVKIELQNTHDLIPQVSDFIGVRVFTGPVFSSQSEFHTFENDQSLLAGRITASTDLFPGTLSFSIAGGDDANLFTLTNVSGNTGVLSFKSAPDYENPADAGADNVYNITVKASDGIFSSTQNITIQVQDVVDETPFATLIGIDPAVMAGHTLF